MTRRDRCYLVARRARLLNAAERNSAWSYLTGWVDSLSGKDIPKFNDLLAGIRSATIHAKQSTKTK